MAYELSAPKVVGATEVRNKFGQLLNHVHRSEEHLVIEKLGIPVAAIISMKEYEQFRRWLAIRMHRELGRKMGEELKRRDITEEQLIAQMDKDRDAVYQEMYGEVD